MMRTGLPKVILTAVVAVMLMGDPGIGASPASAQVDPVNAGLGLLRVINAINRRNRTYQAARDTKRDFDAYYRSLQDTARGQLRSGELHSLRSGASGPETVRVAAYVRLTQALAAEQTAITRAIDAETNQARRDFNRTLVRQLQEIVIRVPGAQQILSNVRTVISNVRTTVIALQAAANANQPLDVLTQRLAEQVSSSALVQQQVRDLGSALGPDLDRALGGALTQVNASIQDVNREANQAVTLLDGMDAQVAELDLSRAEVAEGDQRVGPLNIRVTDRATAALDVASQALAYLSLMQSPGGMTREQLYQQIRSDLLNERNAQLLDAALHVSQVVCKGVGRGEYEAAVAALGKAPENPDETEKVSYIVCTEWNTGQPIRAWMSRVGRPTPAPGSSSSATATSASIPVGTYVGEVTLPSWIRSSSPPVSVDTAISVNTVRVTVNEDGRVEGEMNYERKETAHWPDCSHQFEESIYGAFTGYLVDRAGRVNLESAIETRWTPIRHTDVSCGAPGSKVGSYTWEIQVQVQGEHMRGQGTVEVDGQEGEFTFEALRE
jgi:hypothetical protein